MKDMDKDYLSEIDGIKNRLKSKLPQIREYKAYEHFEYLSNNHDYISIETIKTIIPFINEYGGFNPLRYLKEVIADLNNGSSHTKLFYKGYIRLISSTRGCNSGGSEVNRTLFGRETIMNEINRMNLFEEKIIYKNNKANMIIGMLLFLECLKVYERREGGMENNDKELMETLDSFRGKGGDMDKVVGMKNYEFLNRQYENKNYLDLKLLSKETEERFFKENPSLLRKIVPVSVRKEPFNFSKRLNGGESSYSEYYEERPLKLTRIFKNERVFDENRGRSLELDYLKRFSKDRNIWKNVGERNLIQKMCQEEPIIYDDNVSPRNFLMKTPRNKSLRIFSTLEGKTTGLSHYSRS